MEIYWRKKMNKHSLEIPLYLNQKIVFDLLVLASGEISHLLSGENDQSQSDRNNQCISFSFL